MEKLQTSSTSINTLMYNKLIIIINKIICVKFYIHFFIECLRIMIPWIWKKGFLFPVCPSVVVIHGHDKTEKDYQIWMRFRTFHLIIYLISILISNSDYNFYKLSLKSFLIKPKSGKLQYFNTKLFAWIRSTNVVFIYFL